MDNLDTQIIKLSLPYVLPALIHMVNLSVLHGHFPTKWKTAKVIPLYKKGDPLDTNIYRPVAILPILSKVLECVVFLQICQYGEISADASKSPWLQISPQYNYKSNPNL